MEKRWLRDVVAHRGAMLQGCRRSIQTSISTCLCTTGYSGDVLARLSATTHLNVDALPSATKLTTSAIDFGGFWQSLGGLGFATPWFAGLKHRGVGVAVTPN